MSDKPTSHGGKRAGAGCKPGHGKYGERTTSVRVPESKKQTVLDFVSALARKQHVAAPLAFSPELLHRAANPEPFAIPLFSHSVRAGFPSPPDDYISEALDS